MTQLAYYVICRNDRKPDNEPGDYALATRQTFSTLVAAWHYADGVSTSREPKVLLECSRPAPTHGPILDEAAMKALRHRARRTQ